MLYARKVGNGIQVSRTKADGWIEVLEDRPALRAGQRYVGPRFEERASQFYAVYEAEDVPAGEINLARTASAARAYLEIAAPAVAENVRQLRRLTRLVLDLHEGAD